MDEHVDRVVTTDSEGAATVSDQSDGKGTPDTDWRMSGSSDATTERVLLLLQPGRDRELFAERLDDYELVVGDPQERESLPEFDLCLVDTATYPSVAETLAERKAESGTYLPVLLVVGPHERTTAVRETADIADDVLPLPTAEPILRSRVGSLLRARRGSLQLDAERERFRTLAETAPSAILTIDDDGVVQYANPTVEQVFGYPPDEVVGEPLTMLMPPGLREAHREGLSRYLKTGERALDWTGTRLPGQHADGHEVPLLLAFAEHWVGGERRFTGTVQDVTEQVERQRELARTNDLLGKTQDIADIGGWEIDAETLDVLWTDQVYEILGLPKAEEPPLDEALDVYHPEDRSVIEAAVEGALEEAEPFDETLRIQRPDGEVRWVRVLGEPVTVDGEVETLRGTFQDITERKEREQELERYETVLETVPETAWVLDEDLEVVFADSSMAEAGLTRAEIIGRSVEAFRTLFVDSEEYAEYVETARAILSGERESAEVVTELSLTDGPAVIEIGLSPLVHDGETEGVVALARDITDRKQRERELERAVDQLRQTRDIADVSGWGYDPETDELWWDEKVREIYGQPESFEPTAESVMALYTPESQERMEAAMERAIVDFEPFDIEIRLDTEPPRWVRVTGEPRVEDGRTTSVRGVVRDITQRKRREGYLERYERIVETADEPVYTLDADLRFTLVNSALTELFDQDREALLGEHVSTLFGDAHAEALGNAATKLYARDDDEPITVETVVTDASGWDHYYQTTVSPKLDADGFRGLVCVSHDVTDVTEHERRLSVLDRVLRHNLRNKMNLVLALARSVRETATAEATAEAGATIEAAAEELLDLGEAARQFHDTLDPGGTDLVEVEDVAEHARRVVEAGQHSYPDATIEADLPATAPARVHTEFELALSELVDNAATHGGPGATVTVEVGTAGDEVVVRVLDDGPGIPELERKALSAGWESPLQHATGLGLWFVQWTVRNSGGTMTIDDREDGGAVVELRLPAADSNG